MGPAAIRAKNTNVNAFFRSAAEEKAEKADVIRESFSHLNTMSAISGAVGCSERCRLSSQKKVRRKSELCYVFLALKMI